MEAAAGKLASAAPLLALLKRTSLHAGEIPAVRDVADLTRNFGYQLRDATRDQDDIFGGMTASLDAMIEQARAFLPLIETQRALENIKRLEQAAQRSVGSVGKNTVAADFHSASGDEGRWADILRWAAFGLLFCALGVGAYVAAIERSLSWGGLVSRLAVEIPLLGGAYFASSEARDHRSYARIERGWEVRLNSFDAFVAELPKIMRDEARVSFSQNFFSPSMFPQPPSLADANSDAVSQLRGTLAGQ